jgi:hypothetical protein
MPIRNLANEGMVAGRLCADHLCAMVVLCFHNATVAAVGDLAFPYPAARFFFQAGHVLNFLLSVCHRMYTSVYWSAPGVPALELIS